MIDPRLQTALILQDILENKIIASEAKQHFDPVANNDLSFSNMLLQTSLRNLVPIKKLLKTYIKKKLPTNAKLALYLLILGTTEILYLSTPDYAVINSYVDIAKKRLDKYVAGFVNAVLRKICNNKDAFNKQPTTEFFPPEFRRIINASYNKKQSALIEASFSNEPLLDITAKSGKSIEDAIILPLGSYRLKNNGNITKISGFSEGHWWVQDFSSSLAVNLLDNVKNKKILDVCAAPGGKTAQLIERGALVTSLDISSQRLDRLKENLKRLKLEAQEIICADAIDWLKNFHQEPYDMVLLDAPCSATGTLRRHPELVHIKTLSDVNKMADVQHQLLNLVPRALKSKGTLIYCTCSLSRTEGEEQIRQFLKLHPEFKTKQTPLPDELKSMQTSEGWIRVLPSHLSKQGGADGFFIAFLTKE
ncbi:MAG: methyltransferase domain-containing protein [Alphaproteobacteria bacterium]|nr:methyltransferase domain-containing protein [Alphaproteobacteria bacterium]